MTSILCFNVSLSLSNIGSGGLSGVKGILKRLSSVGWYNEPENKVEFSFKIWRKRQNQNSMSTILTVIHYGAKLKKRCKCFKIAPKLCQ